MTSRKQRSKSLQSSKKRMRRGGSTKKRSPLREVALAKVKDDFSKYLRLAAGEKIIITRHGRPAGVHTLYQRCSTTGWPHDESGCQRIGLRLEAGFGAEDATRAPELAVF